MYKVFKIINRIAKFNHRQIIQEQFVIKRQDKEVIPSSVKVNLICIASIESVDPKCRIRRTCSYQEGKNVPHGNEMNINVHISVFCSCPIFNMKFQHYCL